MISASTDAPLVADLAKKLTPSNTRLHPLWCNRLRETCLFVNDGERTFEEIRKACNLTRNELQGTIKHQAPHDILVVRKVPRQGPPSHQKAVRVSRDAIKKILDSTAGESEPDEPTDPEKLAELLEAFDFRKTRLSAQKTGRLRAAFQKFGNRRFSYPDMTAVIGTSDSRMYLLVSAGISAGILIHAGLALSPSDDGCGVAQMLRFDLAHLERLAAVETDSPSLFESLGRPQLRALERLDLAKAQKVIPDLTECRLSSLCHVLAAIRDRCKITCAKLEAVTGLSDIAVDRALNDGKRLEVLESDGKRGPVGQTLTVFWKTLSRYKSSKNAPDFALFTRAQTTPLYERSPLFKRTTPDQDELLAAATPYWRELGYESEPDWLNVRACITVIGDECDSLTIADLALSLGAAETTFSRILRMGERHIEKTKLPGAKRRGPRYRLRTRWAPIDAVVSDNQKRRRKSAVKTKKPGGKSPGRKSTLGDRRLEWLHRYRVANPTHSLPRALAAYNHEHGKPEWLLGAAEALLVRRGLKWTSLNTYEIKT